MCGSGDILFSNLSWPGITTSSLIRSAAAFAADRAAVMIVRVYFMVDNELCHVLRSCFKFLLRDERVFARYFRFSSGT